MRGADGEAELPSLNKLRDQDLLDEEMKEKMLLGVSTRNYSEAIEGYKGKFGDSKSSVSRAFDRASKKDLDAINHSDLSEFPLIGLVLDGLEIKGRTVIAAVGITDELGKIPVGLIEGSSENSQVVMDLLQTLLDRGFTRFTAKGCFVSLMVQRLSAKPSGMSLGMLCSSNGVGSTSSEILKDIFLRKSTRSFSTG